MQYYTHRPLSQRIVKSTSQSYSPLPSISWGKYRNWDEAALSKAIDARKAGMSFRRSAAMYGIPTTTLYDHVSGKVEIGAHPGPKRYLDQEEEELASFILQIAKIGYPRNKAQILALVQQIIEYSISLQSYSTVMKQAYH